MKPQLRSIDETHRWELIRRYNLLDARPQQAFDDLAALAARLCKAPISLISLIGEHGHWLKSQIGLAAAEIPAGLSFCEQAMLCDHDMLQPLLFVVPDATQDESLAGNPLVTGDSHVRFFAGAALLTESGQALGTLAIMDRAPRQLSRLQRDSLKLLGRQVMSQLELHRRTRELLQGEAGLFQVLRSCPVPLTIHRLSNRTFVEVNSEFSRLLGWTREEVIGRTPGELHIVEQDTEAQLWYRLETLGKLQDTETVVRTRTGESRRILLSTALVELSSGPHAITTFVDITGREQAEDALREKNAQLETALEMARMGVWFWDLRTDEVVPIQGSGPVSGLPADVYPKTGPALMALVHPEDRVSLARKLERARTTGDYEAEFRMLLPDGSLRWVSARGQWMQDAKGVVLGVESVARDVTDQRIAEQHVRHLNRIYSLLSEINQTIVRESDPQAVLSEACRIAVETGQFRMAWIGMRGAPGQPMKVAAHAGASDGTLEILHSMFSGNQPGGGCAFTLHALETGEHSVCNDLVRDPQAVLWRADALERGYRGMASLPLKAGDEVIGIFNLYAGEPDFFDEQELRLLDELALDISFKLEVCNRETERRRVEQASRESEERFRQLAENIQEVFWMNDPATNQVLYVSPAYERIWGRTCASLYESPGSWLYSIHPDDRAQVVRAAEVMRKTGAYNETFRIQRPDGTVRWIHDRGFPVRGAAGEVLRIVGTAEDITERRQLEEQFRQAQKMEAIGQLAGGVAHDFNNLLTVIRGYGSLLLAADQGPEATAGAAKEIVRAAERAASLTRQLLAFSRRQVMQPRSLDLNEIVTGLTSMLQRTLGADVYLQFVLHDRPLMTRADAGMLDQLLMNLVINARDAMPEGGQLVIGTSERTFTADEVAATPDARPGRYVSLRVGDTGSGISPDDLSHIFEPFFTTKQPGKGTGLGLATVFGIVKQHGGWIQVDSEMGRGTSFQVFLPSDQPVPEPHAEEVAAPEAQGGTETILIVEDEPAVRTLTRIILEPQGYRVLEAADGIEALQVWEQHQDSIDLLLTDIMMPEGLSGFELATHLQSCKPKLRVIFTTGYSADIAGRQLHLEEGQNFIQKPSSPRQLLETVRQCLDR